MTTGRINQVSIVRRPGTGPGRETPEGRTSQLGNSPSCARGRRSMVRPGFVRPRSSREPSGANAAGRCGPDRVPQSAGRRRRRGIRYVGTVAAGLRHVRLRRGRPAARHAPSERTRVRASIGPRGKRAKVWPTARHPQAPERRPRGSRPAGLAPVPGSTARTARGGSRGARTAGTGPLRRARSRRWLTRARLRSQGGLKRNESRQLPEKVLEQANEAAYATRGCEGRDEGEGQSLGGGLTESSCLKSLSRAKCRTTTCPGTRIENRSQN